MTRDEADDAFACLTRHARAVPVPTDPAAALALVEKVTLAQLQRTAIVHYISVGPAVVNLAYRVLKAGTATFVAARFAGGEADLFAARMIALDEKLAGTTPADRAGGLLDALAADLDGGRGLLGAAAEGDRDGVGDLLEAAGIAYVLAQLLEDPPKPAALAAG